MDKRTMFKGGERMLFANASQMRKQPTPAEDILWGYLRTKPLGCKFRRQHVFGIYILDFYAHSLQLAIEVDGSIHDTDEAQKADAARQSDLERLGLTVFRFRNKDVETNLADVQKRIEHFIMEKRPLNEKTQQPKSPL